MSIDTDYATLREVLAEHKPQGWAIEFGVYSGYSLGLIAKHMPAIGLDSFEGLPEDWREDFPAGTFHIGEDVRPESPDNAMIVPGLFADTLPMLQERGIPSLGLVHIDCDLYSSTVTALEGVTAYVHYGTILVFDEFHGYDGAYQHEEQAFNEWLDRHSIGVEEIARGEQECAFRITNMGPVQ